MKDVVFTYPGFTLLALIAIALFLLVLLYKRESLEIKIGPFWVRAGRTFRAEKEHENKYTVSRFHIDKKAARNRVVEAVLALPTDVLSGERELTPDERDSLKALYLMIIDREMEDVLRVLGESKGVRLIGKAYAESRIEEEFTKIEEILRSRFPDLIIAARIDRLISGRHAETRKQARRLTNSAQSSGHKSLSLQKRLERFPELKLYVEDLLDSLEPPPG